MTAFIRNFVRKTKRHEMKTITCLLAACAICLNAFAWQTVERSRLIDNWFLGWRMGLSARPSHTAMLQHLNPGLGVELGRYLTPAYGLGIQVQAALDDGLSLAETGLAVKGTALLLAHYVNLNHLVCGYNGRPDIFEITAVAALGWGHRFEKRTADYRTANYLSSRFALQFAVNPGRKRAWQVFAEPFLSYEMRGTSTDYQPYFNVNRAQLGLAVGASYRFKNSNGTHHFKWARLYDQVEVDALNAKINELRRQLQQASQKP